MLQRMDIDMAYAPCAWLFSTASLCLFLSALCLASWSIATGGNGELGLWHFCPNTSSITTAGNSAHDASGAGLEEADEPRCSFVSRSCLVELGYTTSTPFGPVYNFYTYDLFNPQPTSPNDPLHELLTAFPGPGSCTAYQTARFCALFAAFAAMTTWLTAPCSVLVPSRKKEGSGSGVTCAALGSLLGLAAISAWAAAVHNPGTSAYGAAFACAISAVVLGFLSTPCLAAIGLARRREQDVAHAERRQRQYMAAEPVAAQQQQEQQQYEHPYQP